MTQSPPPPPTEASPAYTLYPATLHPLSPTLHTWVRLSIASLLALRAPPPGFAGQPLLFHLNHPIRYVRLVGVLVAFDDYERRWIMVLDDGSGATVEVVCPKPRPRQEDPPPDLAALAIDVGSVVKVKGEVNEWMGARQVVLKRLQVVRSTAEEVKCWGEVSETWAAVLSRPWVVGEDEKRALFEGVEREARRKRRRERGREHRLQRTQEREQP